MQQSNHTYTNTGIIMFVFALIMSLFGCTEGADYTYIEANAIFGHTASDSSERIFLLSGDGLAYVSKTTEEVTETNIPAASFPQTAGDYVYCQLPAADSDSDNPNKLELWRFPVDSPYMSHGEKLFEIDSPERITVADRIYIECVYNDTASIDLTGGDARKWNGELHIQTSADGEYTLVRLDDTGRHSLRLDGKEVCTVDLNPVADYRFNDFMYFSDGICYYIREGTLYSISSDSAETELIAFEDKASSFESAGVFAICGGGVYYHDSDRLFRLDVGTGVTTECKQAYDETSVYFISRDDNLFRYADNKIESVE